MRGAVWAVGFTWASAVVCTVLAVLERDVGQGLMALVAAINAAGWLMATRRWLEWSVVSVALLATLEFHSIREWPDGSPITDDDE
jgi:predicted Co/Zn/Cd cation transporter (cation efflux family)